MEKQDYIKEASLSDGLVKDLLPKTPASSEIKQGDTSTWFSLLLAQRTLPASPLNTILIYAIIYLNIFSMVILKERKCPWVWAFKSVLY